MTVSIYCALSLSVSVSSYVLVCPFYALFLFDLILFFFIFCYHIFWRIKIYISTSRKCHTKWFFFERVHRCRVYGKHKQLLLNADNNVRINSYK